MHETDAPADPLPARAVWFGVAGLDKPGTDVAADAWLEKYSGKRGDALLVAGVVQEAHEGGS